MALRYAPQSIDASPEVLPGMIVLCLLKWVASPQASSISKLIEFKPMGLRRKKCDEWANPFRIHWPGKPTSKVRICANQLHESSNGLCGRVAEQWTPGPQRFAMIRQSLGLTLIGTAFSKCLAMAIVLRLQTTSDRTTGQGGPSLLEGLQRPRTYLWLSSWKRLQMTREFTIVVKPVPGSLRRWPRQWHMNGELRPYVPMELAMVLSFKDAECTTNWTASLAHPLA